MSEEWAPIPSAPGFEASSAGRVRGVDRIVPRPVKGDLFVPGRIMKPSLHDGYPRVNLGRSRKAFVHRLVLEAFVGPCPDGMEALHADGDRSNASLSNLSWGTKSENQRDSVMHGTHQFARRTHCVRGHPLESPNLRPRPYGRSCLACSRAASVARNARKRGEEVDLQRLSDEKYMELVGVADRLLSIEGDSDGEL